MRSKDDRLNKVKSQLDNLPLSKLKRCVVKGQCFCTGCVNTLGVSSMELREYKINKGMEV